MNSQVIMKSYYVNSVSFERNDRFRPKADVPIRMLPEFKRTIYKVNDVQAVVKLSLELKNGGEDIPFSLSAAISGVFEMQDWDKSPVLSKVLADMAVTVLYPYLRSLVTTITANACMPPYNLPIINIVSVFDNESKKQPDVPSNLQ